MDDLMDGWQINVQFQNNPTNIMPLAMAISSMKVQRGDTEYDNTIKNKSTTSFHLQPQGQRAQYFCITQGAEE